MVMRVGTAVIGLGVTVLCAWTWGCRCGNERAQPAASAAPSVALPPELAAKVLARVGEHEITLGDYAATLARMDRFERLRYQSPERRKKLLEDMITVRLLADEARRRGLDRDPEVRARIRQVLRDEALRELRAGLPGPEAIPEAEVQAYYQKHRSDFRSPERRRIAAIVTTTREDAAAALEAARGAEVGRWGELVRKHSTVPPTPDAVDELAGDLGFVTQPGDPLGQTSSVPDPVRSAAFAVGKQGEVHPTPVEVTGKWYVVRVIAINPPAVRTYAETERSIRVTLAQDRVRAAEAKLEQELRAKFPVEIDQAVLEQLAAPGPSSGG